MQVSYQKKQKEIHMKFEIRVKKKWITVMNHQTFLTYAYKYSSCKGNYLFHYRNIMSVFFSHSINAQPLKKSRPSSIFFDIHCLLDPINEAHEIPRK